MCVSTRSRVAITCRNTLLLGLLIHGFAIYGNHQPQANHDGVTAFVGQWVAVDVLANDRDLDGDELEIEVLASTLPANSEAQVTEGQLVIFRIQNTTASAVSFDYEVDDGSDKDRATVTVSLLPYGPHARVFAQEYQYRHRIQRDGLFSNFPESSVGRRVSKLFLLRNAGPEPLTVEGPFSMQSPSGAFSFNAPDLPPPGTVIGPYGEHRFRVFFRPQSLGVHTAQLTLPIDDPSGVFAFDVEGMALEPQHVSAIRVEQNGVFIPNGGSFDSRQGPGYEFEIISTGSQPLELGVYRSPEDYEITRVPEESLPSGGTGVLGIRLVAPTFPATEGVLTFETNVPDGETFQIFENHWPDAVNDTRAIPAGEGVFINLTANDSDPDGDELALEMGEALFPGLLLAGNRYTSTRGAEIYRIDDRIIQYIPAPGFQGQDDFTYRVHDGRGRSDLGLVIVEVGSGTSAPSTLELIAQDEFGNPSASLHGQPVEYHRNTGATWWSSPELKVGGDRLVSAPAQPGEAHLKAYMPFRPWQYGGTTVEMEAEVKLRDTKWMALALTHGGGGVFGNQADLVFLLRPDGRGTLLASHLHPLAACDPITSGYAVDPDTLVAVKMRYDQGQSAVSVWIDGRRVIDRVPFSDPNRSTPLLDSITNAGIYVVTPVTGSAADAFAFDHFQVRQGAVFQGELLVMLGEQVVSPGEVVPLHIDRGQTGHLNLDLVNAGNEPLEIDRLELVAPSQWRLIQPTGSPVTLPPGAATNMQLALDGSQTGAFPGVFSFDSNDPVTPAFSVQLDGHVTVPQISLFECRKDSPQGPLVTNGETLTYRDSFLGRLGVLSSLVIDNTSGQTLNLSVSQVGSGWVLESFTGGTLAPGARAFLKYRAVTTTLGPKTVTVSIEGPQLGFPFQYTLWTQVLESPPAPVITFQTSGQTVWPGSTVSFVAHVEGGTPPFVYDWSVDNECCGLSVCSVSTCSLPGVSGATSTELIIDGVESAHVGGYNFHVTDGNGMTASSHRSFLNLYQLWFDRELFDQYGDGSQPISFTVQVFHDPNRTPTYSWFYNDVPIDLTNPAYSGADTATLQLTAPTALQAGLYRCEVADGLDVITSTASFFFVEPSDQVIEVFDLGLPSWMVPPLHGKPVSYGNRIWTATSGLTFYQGVLSLAPGFTDGAASVPFEINPDRISRITLQERPTTLTEGSRLTVALLSEPQVPWTGDAPFELSFHRVDPETVEISSRSGGAVTATYTWSNPNTYLFPRMDLVYNPMVNRNGLTCAGYFFYLPEVLDTAYVGVSLEANVGGVPSNPRLQYFEANHADIVVAHDDVFDQVVSKTRDLYFDPTLNDEGPVQDLQIAEPEHGTADLVGPFQVHYRPPFGFVGEDRLTYSVANTLGSRSYGAIDIRVRETVDQVLAMKEGFLQVTAGETLIMDPNDWIWTTSGGPAALVSVNYPVQPLKGFANANAEGLIQYRAFPGMVGFDSFSVEMMEGQRVFGTVQVLIRPETGGTYREDFGRSELIGQPIHRATIESGNSSWIVGVFPQEENGYVQPLTFADGYADFVRSEDMHALLPVDVNPAGDVVLVATVDMSDPTAEDRLLVGFAEKSWEHLGRGTANPGVKISLERGFVIQGVEHALLRGLGNHSFEASRLSEPVDLRLHLRGDGGVDLFLDRERVLASDLVSLRREGMALKWAGFGLDARGGEGLPKVRAFELREHGPPGVPDPLHWDDFEGDLSAWSRVSGAVSVQAGNPLFGDLGLRADIAGDPAFVEWTSPRSEPEIQGRWYLDVSELQMAVGDAFVLFMVISDANEVLARAEIRQTTQGYQILARARANGSSPWSVGSWVSLPSVVNLIETSFGQDQFRVTVNRNLVSDVPQVVLPAARILRLGAVSGIDAGTSGSLVFDAWQARKFTPTDHKTLFSEAFRTGSLEGWTLVNEGKVRPRGAGLGDHQIQFWHDGTQPVSMTRQLPHELSELTGSFRFDPNGLAMTGNAHEIFQAYDGAFQGVVRLVLNQNQQGEYFLQARFRDNSGAWVLGQWHAITDEIHEVGWGKHHRNGPEVTFTLNGVVKDQMAVDTSNQGIALIRFGAVSSLDLTTAGSVYFDDIRVSKYFVPVED